MKLSKVTEDDLGVIGNYLIELMEQNKLGNIKEVVSAIDKVLLSNESWKVEVGDKIVAFACVEEINSEVAKVANFYVAPEYRRGHHSIPLPPLPSGRFVGCGRVGRVGRAGGFVCVGMCGGFNGIVNKP